MLWKIVGGVLIVLGLAVLALAMTMGTEGAPEFGGVATMLAYGIQLTIFGVGMVVTGLMCVIISRLK
ncbi:hypothetical protein [Brevundimonas sp. GCM10030266]|uniref:hypothetical protein n=1 Tax=Brevundimonas sp. GCM10030266 TaxID=3273386 RepID=UPI003614AAD5